MAPEPGDDLDCPFCDATHELRQAKGVRVQGFAQRVRSGPYVECPDAGYLAVTGDGEVERVGDDDGEREDWP